MHVDEENDINRVRDYFSYEHFYVLYCRFFELDADKDTKLSVEDVLRYSDHALSENIVDRIFQVGQRVFSDGREGGFRRSGMSYPDFVFLMLAEEDRTSVTSLKYWFQCCDLDGDGILTPEELNGFYKVQCARAVNLGQEEILFKDVLCQLVDLIDPKDPRAITIHDLTYPPEKRALSGVLFDVLFNLQKFLKFETRDPFQEKLKREDGFACEWDRFAAFEYQRLATEDTVYDDMDIDAEQVQQQMQMELDSNHDADDFSGGGGGGYGFEDSGHGNNGSNGNVYGAGGNIGGAHVGIDDDYSSDDADNGGNNRLSHSGGSGSRDSRGSGSGRRTARRRNGEKEKKESGGGTRSSGRATAISNRRK